MPAAPGDASAASLAAALADPAVLVDGGGFVMAWNAAAGARLGIAPDAEPGTPVEALVGERACSARRFALADPPGAALLIWPGADGPGADDVALEKMAIIGRISGGVLHDIKNPLGALMGLAELMANDPSIPADLRSTASDVDEAARRILAISSAMLEFARDEPRQVAPVRVADLARNLVALLGHSTMNMQIRVAMPDTLPEVESDPGELRQALLAVLVNALEAQGASWRRGQTGTPGRLIVSGRHLDDERGRRVRIAVEDGAPPVPEAEQPSLFTGSGAGRAGRDLAVASLLVARAGGRMFYEPVPSGNRIVIELPVAGEPPLPERDPGAQPTPEPAPVILVCDPMPLIRTLLVRFTSRIGVRAVEARDRAEALEIVGREQVAMVLADLGAGTEGAELYDAIVAVRPDLASRFVPTSADPGGAPAVDFTARTGLPVLAKPFDNGRLERLVRDTLGL